MDPQSSHPKKLSVHSLPKASDNRGIQQSDSGMNLQRCSHTNIYRICVTQTASIQSIRGEGKSQGTTRHFNNKIE